ncbi:hypothetical protein [Rhizobium binxianense]
MSAPYHIDYIIEDDAIVIVAIRHGRQQEIELDDDEDFEAETDDA